ncbi:MAG: ATP-binding protein [Prosthecobacter sp.]|uniref:FtsK/SpoIIIE domain-containing protein n=1 Tax=Prosthecobacter sp. TaxID=1965333 RepID=UPI001A07A540|nr:FtsK/SpoIIIE domain-containing protein [Prosthecobacter sp.]MBE2286426.1 ATP-binding protein [Prosthecobacter sp.]
MSSPTDLRASRILSLHHSLRDTVADFARRSEQIARETRARRYTAEQNHLQQLEAFDAQHNATLGDTARQWDQYGETIRARHAARTTAFKRYEDRIKRDLPAMTQKERERWLGKLQIRRVQADSARKRGVQQADAIAASLLERLTAARDRLLAVVKASGERLSRRSTPRVEGLLTLSEIPACVEAIEAHAQTLEEQLASGKTSGLLKMFSKPSIDLALLSQAVADYEACVEELNMARENEVKRLHAEFEATDAQVTANWGKADEVAEKYRAAMLKRLATQIPACLARNERLLARNLRRFEAQKAASLAEYGGPVAQQRQQIIDQHATALNGMHAAAEKRWSDLTAEWEAKVPPLLAAVDEINSDEASKSKPWSPHYEAREAFPNACRFGQLSLDLSAPAALLEKDTPLNLAGHEHVTLPLALAFPGEGSLLIETDDDGGKWVADVMNGIVFHLLSLAPPGKAHFTIIDAVGLGQNFAGLMHLADYEPLLINRRIWTQRDHIEERLAELNEHVEKVIQMYLRNEYATITEYNEHAGSVAEKYHFLVIAGLPAGFSETGMARLKSIVTSGARCGVFTLIHWDRRHNLPEGLAAEDLRKNSLRVVREKGVITFGGLNTLTLESAPTDAVAAELAHQIGQASIDSNRVQVPFSVVAPKEMWSESTTNELRIAIGRTGATKLQYLAIGKGTKQHALLAGKTGSGKSTLLHIIITNLALTCSPDEVEFYLIDFKKGVEFKCYADAKLPHAKVIAIESDREFALSVLQRIDEELKRRGELYRKLGAQDLAGYKRAGGTEPMPRSMLIIDEFQEFFVEDDSVAQGAALLLDRIVRQGRAFGIHVFLGSQTLGGAYTLARTTLGQMVIRIALQCNEADAALIMDEGNVAARLLSRPGEGIYNDAAGALEGNSPFQVVWLTDEERDENLAKVSKLGQERGFAKKRPIVFEGNMPADVRDNPLLVAALENPPAKAPTDPRVWLGLPNAIKGPTDAMFPRQSGRHLLLVGQNDEAIAAIMGLAIIGLAAQHPRDKAPTFYLVHGALAETPEVAFLEAAAAKGRAKVTQGHEAPDFIAEIHAEMKRRSDEGSAGDPPIFLLVHGLQKFRKLRYEEDFSFGGDDSPKPGNQLNEIINEGPPLGIHLITSLDTLNNIQRCLSRKALSELGMRVLFQMSANDSASLIDSPKAGSLGLNRALFYSEHESRMETFRPFALPGADWVAEATSVLS